MVRDESSKRDTRVSLVGKLWHISKHQIRTLAALATPRAQRVPVVDMMFPAAACSAQQHANATLQVNKKGGGSRVGAGPWRCWGCTRRKMLRRRRSGRCGAGNDASI